MTGRGKGVGVEEAAEVGGVISGGQIVQFCLFVEMYSPMGIFYSILMLSVKVLSSTYISVPDQDSVTPKPDSMIHIY